MLEVICITTIVRNAQIQRERLLVGVSQHVPCIISNWEPVICLFIPTYPVGPDTPPCFEKPPNYPERLGFQVVATSGYPILGKSGGGSTR